MSRSARPFSRHRRGVAQAALGLPATPDSLVAVMMITDENDCSVQDVGQRFTPL